MKFLATITAIAISAASLFAADKKHVLLLGGRPSHGAGQHEHTAGILLFAKCLGQGAADLVEVKYRINAEWPPAEELAWADTILIYCDGGGGHLALQGDRLTQLAKEMKRGCGFVCVHYAVEPAYLKDNWNDGPPPPERASKGKGSPEFLDWLGGYFEQFWSVNPHWPANFKELPKHAITSGVKPFGATDEWYYHMRFPKDMKGVTPILSDVPPETTTKRGEGPHSGNPEQKKAVLELKQPQHVAWAVARPDGGRGFGFTGGHFHKGWGNDDQRKLLLNAIVWTAKAEVPPGGIESTVTAEDLLPKR